MATSSPATKKNYFSSRKIFQKNSFSTFLGHFVDSQRHKSYSFSSSVSGDAFVFSENVDSYRIRHFRRAKGKRQIPVDPVKNARHFPLQIEPGHFLFGHVGHAETEAKE